MKPLPPYGKQYLLGRPDLGPWVACGAEAWEVAKASSFPRMVLPPGDAATAYRWPVSGMTVTITEHGIDSPDLIRDLARVLIADNGADAVIARRSVGGLMTFTRIAYEYAA